MDFDLRFDPSQRQAEVFSRGGQLSRPRGADAPEKPDEPISKDLMR
ncbi:MAG: hypothetical protein IJS01_03100 [Lentisphaeria bacterium]|nr:hypothetical protein [Lentisphaeria bacterium]